jgi:hypothetical protein
LRLLGARRVNPKPAKVKANVSQIVHLDAPIKGLSLLGKTSEGDPQTATILTNWIVKEDRISVRPGTTLIDDRYPTGTRYSIEQLMPYLAAPDHVLLASNNTVSKIGGPLTPPIAAGFAGNDWHWTMFANLAQAKYLVMVNGFDGVWSYDGGALPMPGAGTGTLGVSSAAGQPAPVTAVAGGGGYVNGHSVNVSGATGAFAVANGLHYIEQVSGNTFKLTGVDTTGATGTQPINLQGYGSMMKEAVLPGTNMGYCNPNNFGTVLAHINHLYFADTTNLVLYYLPLSQKSGTLKQVTLNAVFRRGGEIRALAAWTLDGGNGMDDKLVIFTTHGQCAIFSGLDPEAADWGLVGIFQFDAPMSKHSVVNYGGDLWVMTSTGLAPLSVLIRSETEKLNKAEKGMVTPFREVARKYANMPGWSVVLDSTAGRMICNLPGGALGSYQQLVRFMPDSVWARWRELNARCWAWLDSKLYFGNDDGQIYECSEDYLADNIRPNPAAPGFTLSDHITATYRGAWSKYRTPGVKKFNLVRVYAQSTGLPVKPFADMAVNFVEKLPENQPDIVLPSPPTQWSKPGAVLGDPGFVRWGAPWGSGKRPIIVWGGVGREGNIGAPYVVVAVNGATYEVSGFEIIYEPGIVV